MLGNSPAPLYYRGELSIKIKLIVRQTIYKLHSTSRAYRTLLLAPMIVVLPLVTVAASRTEVGALQKV